ncbi:MAG: hypothetical protein P8179_19990, partial [Candidatus Thiodiazotropha sp.]
LTSAEINQKNINDQGPWDPDTGQTVTAGNQKTIEAIYVPDNINVSRDEALRAKWGDLSSSERSALLQAKAEANAYRRLSELEDSIPGAHFLEKHGAQTNLQSQLDRVQFGVNPKTKIIETWPNGNTKYPSSVTRFLSHRDQLNTIQRTQHIYKTTGNQALAERPMILLVLVISEELWIMELRILDRCGLGTISQ